MRGKLVYEALTHGKLRLIPAHAGKTKTDQHTALALRAHPRSRGENQ